MGLSIGGSKESSESTSTFDQNVWGDQAQVLNDFWGQLNPAMQSAFSGIMNQIPGAVGQMDQVFQGSVPAWQNQQGGGATKDMGLQNSLMNSLNQSLNNPSVTQNLYDEILGGQGNTSVDAMKDMYVDDASRAQQTMLQNLDARAAAAGMSGGSRHGTATAQGMEDINRNLQGVMATTGLNAFDKDLDRKLSIGGQADANRLAREQMLLSGIQGQDQASQFGLGFGNQMQNFGLAQFAPWQMYGQTAMPFAQMYGNPTVLNSASSTSESDSGSIGGSIF